MDDENEYLPARTWGVLRSACLQNEDDDRQNTDAWEADHSDLTMDLDSTSYLTLSENEFETPELTGNVQQSNKRPRLGTVMTELRDMASDVDILPSSSCQSHPSDADVILSSSTYHFDHFDDGQLFSPLNIETNNGDDGNFIIEGALPDADIHSRSQKPQKLKHTVPYPPAESEEQDCEHSILLNSPGPDSPHSQHLPDNFEDSTLSVDEISFGPEYFWAQYSEEETECSGSSSDVPVQHLSIEAEDCLDNEESDEGNQAGGSETPLYHGAQINRQESLTAILSFVQSENITGAGIERLISLIDLHLPQPNNFFKSKLSMFELLKDFDDPVHEHFYCSICFKTLKSSIELCDSCSDESRSVNYFLTFPLEPQLKRLFKRPDFRKALQYKVERVKQNIFNIEDVYDGEVYKEMEDRFLSTDFDITFMYNTDGVSTFKSNNFSLWNFYLVINELPFEKRFVSENLVIAGIWGSVHKPHPNVYLLPIYKELNQLREGFDMKFSEDESHRVRARCTCGSCDAPATAAFLNMKGHSGFYSCPICLTKGIKVATDAPTSFPYEENVPLRSLSEYKEHVKCAVDNRVICHTKCKAEEKCFGIKGPTILSHIVPDIFKSTAIDSMHCVYLGVMRQMLNLWFHSSDREGDYCIQGKMKIVNNRLHALSPPHYLNRVPQGVDKLVHWKATELRSFLFNISIIVLSDILPSDYYDHFSLFVGGVSLLNTESISNEDLTLSTNYLTQFVKQFADLYNIIDMSHNVHMLLHLPQSVKNLGPLWAVSCFKFEDINGRITNLIHGTRHIGLQVYASLAVITQLPIMIRNLSNSRVKMFCQNIKKRYRLKLTDPVAPGIQCVGSLANVNGIEMAWVHELLEHHQVICDFSTVQVFYRLLKHGILFVSSSYSRGVRVSSLVSYKEGNEKKYGNVVAFIKLDCLCVSPQCSCKKHVAIVKPTPVTPLSTDFVNFRHLFRCDTPTKFQVGDYCCLVDVNDLCLVMFRLLCNGVEFLAEPLNRYELE